MNQIFKCFILIISLLCVSNISDAQVKTVYFRHGIVTTDSLNADSYGYFGKISDGELYILKALDFYNQVLFTGSYKDEKMLIRHGEFTFYTYTDDYNYLSPIYYDVRKYPVFVSSKRNFEDGLLHGISVEYYPDGKIRSIANYERGIKNGLYEAFDPNQRLISSGYYKKGLQQGKWIVSKGKIVYYYNGSRVPMPKFNEIHHNATLIDTHGDILYNQIKSGIDIGKLQQTGHFDLERAKVGGLDAQVFSIWSDQTGGYSIANQEIDSLYSLIKRYPHKITLVKNANELLAAVKEKKLAAMIGVEGGHMIENDLNKLESLAERGMIYLTLTWNNSTNWASSAADETSGRIVKEKAGLSDFGVQVVKKLNELGVMIDLSHVGEKTFYDVLSHTTKPVILSHSSVYALNPVARNVKDEQIKAIGENGGLISLNLYNGFLDSNYRKNLQKFLDKHAEELSVLSKKNGRSDGIDTLMNKFPMEAEAIKASIELAIDHIDHIVKLVGVDHVGIGADFDGAESFPKGLNSVADYPIFTKALIDRGYTIEEVRKILGENFIRVFQANRGN